MISLALLATIVIELLMFVPLVWKFRNVVLYIMSLTTPAITVVMLILDPSILTVGLLFISMCRVFNLLRIAQARMHERYLYLSTRRTSLIFCCAQLALLIYYANGYTGHINVAGLLLLQLIAACSLFGATLRNLSKTRYRPSDQRYSDKELPTVTVAIPARNETLDLEECLQSILANDYPKLEILVLDDCSADRTPDIIKQFAHDGVRFIKGDEPEPSWLAKNQAYERLSKHASGELLLFCGVDVRLGQGAIRELVSSMLSKQKQMISVMPLRTKHGTSSAFIQPMRYWWELALPRRLFNRPPVISSCWIVKRDTLKDIGGFAAAKRMIIPEAYLAKRIIGSDGYSFMRAGGELDIRTEKTSADQRDTAVRVRYPQLHKRPEIMIGLISLEMLLLIGPFVLLTAGLTQSDLSTIILAGITCALLLVTHILIMRATNAANSLLALFTFPSAVLTEMTLSLTSMIQYEFFTVEWKNRNACFPVMHAAQRLPEDSKS